MTMSFPVVMYRTRFCPYCVRAAHLLKRRGVDFEQIDISGDGAARARLTAQTGSRTVPQIFVRGEFIGGCDELVALDRSGELDALLAGES